MKLQRGLSLVELMIAILISSLLLIGVLDLFANNNAATRSNTALSRVQESGRILLDIIGTDALRAGYQGCSAASNTAKVGSLKFPDDALAATSTSLTLRYATPTNTGTGFANRACNNADLYLYAVTYSNCSTGGRERICRSLNGGSNSAIVDDARITAISFDVPVAGNQKWVSAGAISTSDLAKATAMRLSLEVTSATEGITPRTFSATYQLRNRL